jgi:hypothetical protein
MGTTGASRLTAAYEDDNAWKFFFSEDTAGDCGNPSACTLHEVDGLGACTMTALSNLIAVIVDPATSPFHVEIRTDIITDVSE